MAFNNPSKSEESFTTPGPTPIGEKHGIINERVLIICTGLFVILVCVRLIAKSSAQSSEESSEQSPEMAAAEAQEAAARASSFRLKSVPTVNFSIVLDEVTDPAAIDATCAICLVDMESASFVKRLPSCRHCYHADCLDRWLRVSELCPLCKTSVLPSSDNNPASVVTTDAQSVDTAEPSLTNSDVENAETGSSPLPEDPPSSPPLSPSQSQTSSLEDIPATDGASAAQVSASRPRHLSTGQLSASFDDAMELVPVSSRRSSRLPLSQSSSSLSRQVRPPIEPTNRARGRTSSGRAARAESSQSTPRRHPPPLRSTRQQHQRAVPGATATTGRL